MATLIEHGRLFRIKALILQVLCQVSACITALTTPYRTRRKQHAVGTCKSDIMQASRVSASMTGALESAANEAKGNMVQVKEAAVREPSPEAGRRLHTSLGRSGHGEQCTQSNCKVVLNSPEHSVHSVRISGHLSQVKAARRTMKKHGFLDKCNDEQFPLNGWWETVHGMRVVIEGKMVRWSQTRASRLRFTDIRKESCTLSLYGETATGHIEKGASIGTSKTLKWSNGDVWHSIEGCCVRQVTLLAQSMTKVRRDLGQDEVLRSKVSGRLGLLCRSGLCLPLDCIEQVKQCIGTDIHYFNVQFHTKVALPWTAEDQQSIFLGSLSRRRLQVELHHAWTDSEEAP